MTDTTTSQAGPEIPPSGIARAQAAPRVGAQRTKSAASAAAAVLRPSRRDAAVFHAAPPALAEIHKGVRDGEWLPGEQHPVLEAAAKVWGYGALGVIAALYGAAWLIQRPGRAAAATAVGLVVVIAVIWPW